MNRAGAAKNTRAAKNDSGDCKKLVTVAGVGLRLTETSGVNNCGNCGNNSGEHISHRDASPDGYSGKPRAFRRKTNRAKRAAKGCAVNQQPEKNCYRDKKRRLSRNAKPAFLSEK